MPVSRVISTLVGALLIAGVASPALACKGTDSLLRDEFTEADPSWNVWWPDTSSFDIADGKVAAKVDPGYWAVMMYDGDFFPAADACIDIAFPEVRDPSQVWAGLTFYDEKYANWIVYLTPDGQAGVAKVTNDGWLYPVKVKAYDSIKQGEANTLRAVWSGPPAAGSTEAADPTVQVFINDQPVFKFKVKPNGNRQVGLAIQTQGDTVEFSNLAITR
jgi:hypothetical protein